MTRLLERLRMTEEFKTTSCPHPDSTSGTSKLNPKGSMYGLIFMVNVGKYAIDGSFGNEQIELIQLSSLWRKKLQTPSQDLIWNSNMWWDCIFPVARRRYSSTVSIFREGLLSENHMIKSFGDLIFHESTWFPLGFPHCCAWYCSCSYCCWLQIELLYMLSSLSLSSAFLLLLLFLFLSLLLVVPLHLCKNRWLNSQKVAIWIRGHDKPWHMGVAPSILSSWYISENSWFSSQIIHVNRVFHYFHHPFWGTSVAKTTCPDTYLPDWPSGKMFGFKQWQNIWLELMDWIWRGLLETPISWVSRCIHATKPTQPLTLRIPRNILFRRSPCGPDRL